MKFCVHMTAYIDACFGYKILELVKFTVVGIVFYFDAVNPWGGGVQPPILDWSNQALRQKTRAS